MRTNIEIDDALLRRAMRASGAKTKRAAVDAALKMLVKIKGQGAIRKLRGKVEFYPDYYKDEGHRAFEEEEKARGAHESW